MSDESTTLRAAIDRAFVPVVASLMSTIGRLEGVAKHGSGDQSPHGNRDKGNPAGTTPADRGSQAARADDNARSKDKYKDNPRLKGVFNAGATDAREGGLAGMSDEQIKGLVRANSGSGLPVSEAELTAYIEGVHSVVRRRTMREMTGR